MQSLGEGLCRAHGKKMKMICYIKQNNDAHTHTGTDMPALDKASMSFTLMLKDAGRCCKTLENVGRCWKTIWTIASRKNESYTSPISSLWSHWLLRCTARWWLCLNNRLPQVKAETDSNANSAAMNITPGKWVSKCRLPQNYMYIYI